MKINNPLVSVIVPNFNHEKYLVKRLDSIFNQTYINFEVILLDDYSNDDSRDILFSYSKNEKVSHYIINETNSGNTFVQWNKGISLAKGEYIWIAESDDFCKSNFLEVLVEPMIKNKEIVLSYCQSNRVNERGKVTGTWLNYTNNLDSHLFLTNFILDGNEFIERFLIYKNVIPNVSAIVFRKKTLDDIVILDISSKFRYCGDWALYFQLMTNNKICYSPKLLNNFRYHNLSVIAKAIKQNNRIKIIDIDFAMKKEVIKFLKLQNISNFIEIKKNNKTNLKKLLFEKAILIYRNENKLKGFFLLLYVLDVFFEKYNLQKIIKNKLIKNFKF